MTTLGGNVCIRNGFRLDYCWREAVKSLLPVCDQVVICDCDSQDSTREFIDRWASQEPKIVVVNYPWTDPRGSSDWWPTWLNYSRQHLSTDMHIQLDADEVLHEEDYELVRNGRDAKATLFFHRLNFWKDHRNLIPDGHCCGTKVLRMAPANMPLPSDYPWEPAAATMAQAVQSAIRVFHYGFLRHREQFFLKAREVQRIWVNDYDPRLQKAETFAGNWMTMEGVTGWENHLVPYEGRHPSAIQQWLKDHNYHD